MEEKKSVKISLSTFFLILAIIAIIIMGYFIYKFYCEKATTLEEVSNLNNEISNLQKTINSLSNVINSETNITAAQNNTTENTVEEFSYTMIKTAFQNYLKLKENESGSPIGILYELGYKNDDINISSSNTYGQFSETSIKYNEYKEKMLNYVSENLLNTEFSTFFIEVNGILYWGNFGSSSLEYELKSIQKNSNNSYSAIVSLELLDGSKVESAFTFTITNYKGKCVIDSCEES